MKKIIFQLFIILLPWKLRRNLLRKFLKFKIHEEASIGKSIILADNLEMAKKSVIGNLTFCKNIGSLVLGERARLGSLNYITGFPQNDKSFFTHVSNRRCELIIGNHSAITSRHFIDCTGGIRFGDYTTFAGVNSQILTHSIDLEKNIQDCKPVKFGSYCFIATGVTVLGGSELPNYSIVGAKSLLNKKHTKESTLYGGVSAMAIKEVDKSKYKYFKRTLGFVK